MVALRTRFASVADVEVMIIGQNRPAINITLQGSPIAQERHRAVRTHQGRLVRFYNPNLRSQRALRRALRQAMADVGITTFPFFPPDARLKLTASFGLSNLAKDVDNLTKYLMDGLETVLYANDNMIFDQHGTKRPMRIDQQFSEFTVELWDGL
jgi:Holliday junction resolvase RusA-like endonuclease